MARFRTARSDGGRTNPGIRALAVLSAIAVVAMIAAALPAQAHVTQDFEHLWNSHIKPRIATADGTINQPSDPVDWTKLKSVPAGFADGVDDAGGGNPVSVGQLRSTGLICNGGCSEGSIPLGPGSWAIWGKITVHQQDFSEELLHVTCRLSTSRDNWDGAFARQLGDTSGTPGSTAGATLNMELFANLPAGGVADLECTDFDIGDTNGFDLYLLAIRV